MTMYTMIAKAQIFATEQPDKFKKILIAGGAFVLLLALLLSCGGGQPTLDVTDYTEVVFHGNEGEGYARVSIDYHEMFLTLAEERQMEDLRSLKAAYGTAAASSMYSMYLSAAVHGEVSENTGLSNGDKIVVTFEINDDICEELGIRIKADKMTFCVKGLN